MVKTKIAFLGEAFGKDEERASRKAGKPRPFVGPAGREFNNLLRQLGKNRSDFEGHVYNIFDFKPPQNNFGVFYHDEARNKPKPELEEAWDRIRLRLKDYNLVFCLGAEPLRAMAGVKGVDKYRGSVLQSSYGTKVIGTYHPSMIVRGGRTRNGVPVAPIMILDLVKAFKECEYPEIRALKRFMWYNWANVNYLLANLKLIKKGDTIAVDIETSPKRGIIWCVSIATSSTSSFVVPFYDDSSELWTDYEYDSIVHELRRVLEDPDINKVGHNFISYDMPWLKKKLFINVNGLAFDTLIGMNVAFPEFPQGLAFAASVFTDIPYWKDDAKDYDNIKDFQTFWNYACLDVLADYEVYEKVRGEVEHNGWKDTFDFQMRHAHKMSEIGQRGISVDLEMWAGYAEQISNQLVSWDYEIEKITGAEINLNSPKQLMEYLYSWLCLEPQTKRNNKGKIVQTVDENALKKLAQKYPDERFIQILTKYRKLATLYKNIWTKVLRDGKMPSSYGWTKNGRLTCSEDPFGFGMNIQQCPSREVEF